VKPTPHCRHNNAPKGQLRAFLQLKRPDGRTRPAGIENYQDYTATQLGVATAYENTHQ